MSKPIYKITVYVTEEQDKWVKALPKSYNLSKVMNEKLGELIIESLAR